MKKLIILALLVTQAACTSTLDTVPARSPYAGEENREIKALSADEVARYRTGEGMGLAMAAELNHYPGPRHVLELADHLQLTDAQRHQVQQAFQEMNTAAIRLGEQIVAHESALDLLFAEEKAGVDSVRDVLATISALQAELRFVHLNAHLATRSVLTDAQVSHYDQLRGYTKPLGAEHDHSGMNH